MLIVGLGNPDKKYLNTYHNVGFMFADKLAELLGMEFKNKECKSLTAVKYFNGEKIIIAKPLTYMNLSGEAVRELIGRYGVDMSSILIAYDDVDIGIGALRYRKSGSAGTHNGMRNIIALTNTTSIPRMRIGIGKAPEFMSLADYVLSEIRGDNSDKIRQAIEYSAAAVKALIETEDSDKFAIEIGNYKE